MFVLIFLPGNSEISLHLSILWFWNSVEILQFLWIGIVDSCISIKILMPHLYTVRRLKNSYRGPQNGFLLNWIYRIYNKNMFENIILLFILRYLLFFYNWFHFIVTVTMKINVLHFKNIRRHLLKMLTSNSNCKIY